MPSDDAAYREASFARSQDSMTQPPTYSRLAAQSTTGRHVQMSAPSKSRMAPQSSAGSFASVARSEASFVSSIGGSRNKEQALADTYARACARLRALEVCAVWHFACAQDSINSYRQHITMLLCQMPKTAGLLSVTSQHQCESVNMLVLWVHVKSEGGHHVNQASLSFQLFIVHVKRDAFSASQHRLTKHVSKDVYVIFLPFEADGCECCRRQRVSCSRGSHSGQRAFNPSWSSTGGSWPSSHCGRPASSLWRASMVPVFKHMLHCIVLIMNPSSCMVVHKQPECAVSRC